MIHKTLFILYYILVLLSPTQAQDAEKNIFIERINNVVTSVHAIHKDKNGFLWIGRWDGLYRYDGINFKSFNHIAKTWTNFAVGSIQEDKAGNLWIGATLHDFLIYNPEKDTIQNVQKTYPEVVIPNLWSEISLHDTTAFVASSERVYIINNKKHNVRTIMVHTTYGQYIKAIKPDDKGNLWIALQYGLLKISSDLKQFYYPQLFTDEFTGILIDMDSSIWIRTISKLIHFNPQTGTQKEFPFLKNNDSRLSDGNSAIERDGKGHIWLGSPSKGGLLRFNPGTEKFDFFPHKSDDPNSVSSNYIRKLVYTKDDDILWIGTEIGLDKIVFNKQNFNVTSLDFPNQQNYIVESLYQDTDSNLWGRTNDQKIHLLTNNPNNHKDDNAWLRKVVSLNPEFYLEDTQDGNILFVGHNDGLFMIDKRNGAIKRTNADLIPTAATPIKYIGNGKILARIDGHAIIISIGDTLHITNDILFSSTRDGVRMMADQYNNILASRGDGSIYILDLVKQEFKNIYKAKEKDPFDLTALLKDQEEVIWIGTAGSGLLSFNLRSQKLKNYGFSDHSIEGILMDDSHNIWASTNKGLLMLNTKNEIVTRYTSQDGFPSGQIRNNAFLKGLDGNFYVGVFDKIISFDPLKIIAHDFIPKIFITKIKVFNQPISELNSQYKVVESISDMTMNYNQNTISFEFASLNYAFTDKTIYYYQMTDVDNNWIQSENQQVTYSNLSPGSYLFKVKASNSHSVENPEIREVRIIILPPPWKTWWAYVLYIILVGSLAYFFWIRWITRIQLESLASIKIAEAKKLREMDTLKSNFFANISHEFRTPLTLLLGPLEKRLALAIDSSDKKELSMMHRNAARLLNLVNQLLDLSRLEAGNLKLKCIQGDLCTIILSIASQFSSIADSKEIHFDIITKEPIILFFDPDKLEKVITNLLSNAFKFTPAGGSISLTITQHNSTENYSDGYAEIKVSDNGAGIESEHLSKIFDRFYQVDMSSTRSYEGSGIGLALTKELVELHHGSISVSSDAGNGSKFIVQLPLGNNHLTSQEFEMNAPDMISLNINEVTHSSPLEEIVVENNIQALPRLLVVEDNADLRYYLKNNLKGKFTILETENGEDGIIAAIEEIPDIIISDLMMPKINGLQLCQQLKEDEKTSHIPIILLTAKVDVETKLMGYRHGADDYIAKPFQIEELLIRIDNLIANRKRIQEKFSRQVTLAPSILPVNSMDERFLKRAMEVVEKALADSSFGVEPFANQMGVSHTQLYRKIHGITGLNSNEFIRHMRLLRAADLMRQKVGNVAEITYMVGFNNLSYFSKVFKEKFGVTPTDFLKKPINKIGKVDS